jgi:hypothetical protein
MHPTQRSIPGIGMEISVQQIACQFSSLPTAGIASWVFWKERKACARAATHLR